VSSLRIRVVKLTTEHGAGEALPYAIQASIGGLDWWTMARYGDLQEALLKAKELADFASVNMVVRPEKVLWMKQL
jgi:hypothetical protein